MEKAALHEGGAALTRGGMSDSLHNLAFIRAIRRRPANVLTHVEGHGFDFAGGLPLVPSMNQLAGIVDNMRMSFA